MDANTVAIVAMAWARTWGLPDDALIADEPQRLSVVSDTGTIHVLKMLNTVLIAGPAWAIEAAADYTDDALTELHGLRELVKERGPSASRIHRLAYCDDYVHKDDLEDISIVDDEDALRELLRRCAPDDVDEADLLLREHRFVLLDESGLPVAAAAYSAQQQILADVAWVCAIDERNTGMDLAAGAIAVNAALDDGLIAQVRLDANADRAPSEALGFTEAARLATVVLPD